MKVFFAGLVAVCVGVVVLVPGNYDNTKAAANSLIDSFKDTKESVQDELTEREESARAAWDAAVSAK